MPINKRAFTLIELLVVMSIIVLLSGLLIRGAGSAQKDAARQRARAEIKAIELALESYKIDNGEYPGASVSALSVATSFSPKDYDKDAGVQALYSAISANTNKSSKVYYPLSATAYSSSTAVIQDPFGYAYGYSASTNTTSNPNYPGISLWSTCGETSSAKTNRWVTNFDPDRP